jgi:hypothetical protein
VGGTLLTWLRELGPRLLQEREVLHTTMGVSPDPWIVFTSNLPGLVAAREILGTNSKRIVYLSEDEFRQWLAHSPDAAFRWHVHFWSLFLDDPRPGFLAEATRRHPISPPCVYWQHAEGTMWGKLAGRGVDHLWKWDGKEPSLLEEALTQWVS